MNRPADLPDGLTVRPPRSTDAQAIFELLAAANNRLTGSPDATLTGVTEGLSAPGFDRETDSWLVLDEAGHAVNFGAVVIGRHADLVICAPDSAGAAWLLDTAIARVGPGTKLEVGVLRQNDALRELITSRGFVRGTSYFQMRIDHHEPVPAPEPPTGVVLVTGLDDERTRHAAYDVLAAAFDRTADELPRYDEWSQDHETRSGAEWSRVTLATLDGRPAAAMETEATFAETDQCGYIARLAVLPSARGKGLGRFLLRHAFAADAAAGLTGTMLHVDSNNPTPALTLYESVGLRTTRISDDWSLTT
jgi:ribosomal protein S18 acetylase RimI-like enzyme